MMDTIFKPRLTKTVILTACLAAPIANNVAGPLNLSNNALEVVNNVEPNIMILHDDSGSMDWGIMTNEGDEGTFHLGGNIYYYTHPDPGALGNAPAVNDDTYVVPTEEFMQAQGLAAPQGGVWRAWSHHYNKAYYNPDITYTPWVGVDNGGNSFSNVSATAAPYDPYAPASGVLDLTTAVSYSTDCGLVDCVSIPALVGTFSVTDFYPARYYQWTDTNTTTASNASNGVVDADDNHTLVEIRPATASYTRVSYNASTGIGRSDCTNNGNGAVTCTYAQEIQNFANFFSYYRKRDLAAKAAFSKVIEPISSARIGYATINNNASNAVRVASMNVSPNNGNKGALLQNLFTTIPNAGTPLRDALDKTGKYFECRTNDIFGSTGNSAPGSVGCPVLAAPAGTCQANYAILISDGFWNGATSPGVNNADSGSGDFDGGAFADAYSNTLADVAMHYYKRDLQNTLDDNVPTSNRDIAGYFGSTNPFATMHQHLSLYTVGFGVNGTLNAGPSDLASAFSWPDPTAGDAEKIDDLLHAAVNGRGLFSSANDPQAFQRAMDNIFNDISSNSGTATAVAFNTQEVEAGTLVFRASFNTKTNSGNLVAQRVNTNGTVDSAIRWSAADQLDTKTNASSDSRIIVSYLDTGSATSTGIPFRWASLTAQQSLLDSPQPANVPPITNTFGDERVDYLRGHSADEGTNGANGEFRERPQTAGKLGDIVHSTPVFVGKPHFIGRDYGAYPTDPYSSFVTANQNRTQLVYTGANDGMLHAFRTDTGAEHFAYVPNNVVQSLPNLTDPNYTHQYYVDLTPSVNDIYMTPTSGTNSGAASWNTVLVGGLGKGGKGYFALNVTEPNDLDSEADAAANVMWEFTEADDGAVGNSDLGYSYSEPLIAMSNAAANGNQRWVAIFGNGYNSTSAGGNAHLYVLFIEAGQDGVWTANSDFIKVNTGYGKSTSSDGTTPNGIGGVRGIDADGNGTVDYVYAGDLQGNLYRFDLSSTTAGNWTASPTMLFQARYSAGNAFPRSTVQPITKRPIVVKHPSGAGYVVIATTGSWMTSDDAANYNIQSIYGVWDDMSVNPLVTMGSVTNQLVKQEFTNHTNLEHGFTVRTLTDNAVTWQNNGNNASKVKGWYIDLNAGYDGERAVRNLQLRGNLIFVNTVIPRNTSECSVGTGGFELAFDPFTGGPGTKTIFDLNNDRTFDYRDNVGDLDTVTNIVTGIRFDNATPTDSAFIGSHRMTQAGDEIRSIDTNTGTGATTGRTSWREIN